MVENANESENGVDVEENMEAKCENMVEIKNDLENEVDRTSYFEDDYENFHDFCSEQSDSIDGNQGFTYDYFFADPLVINDNISNDSMQLEISLGICAGCDATGSIGNLCTNVRILVLFFIVMTCWNQILGMKQLIQTVFFLALNISSTMLLLSLATMNLNDQGELVSTEEVKDINSDYEPTTSNKIESSSLYLDFFL